MIALALALAFAAPEGASQAANNCPPAHAAMGHCVPSAPADAPPPPPPDPCPPEHAAMGHCVRSPSADAPPPPDPCPPEHAAMGHCTPLPRVMPMTVSPAPVSCAASPAPAHCSPPPSTNRTPPSAPCPAEHAAMGHCAPATMPLGTDQPAGNAPPPAPPTDRAAAQFYDPARMAAADRAMRAEHGGMRMGQVMFNLAELQIRNGRDGYRWDGEGWFGGDINRLAVKFEGEGSFGKRVESVEVQALYARAIDPYWNLQAGIRQDIGAGARRTYATVGVEGLAPYWFDIEAALFLSDKGDVLARAEASYDQRLTQRLILQPRLELNVSAQDMPASRIGAGLSQAEAGLRLRYEIAREFSPYIGMTWERRFGETARMARTDGDGTGGFALALGVRAWF